jgi:cell division protease FtsH
VGLWLLVIRRMGGTQGGLLAVGKSRARVYAQHSTGVTFDDVAGIDEARSELVSIIPRGVSALGYTQQRPTEDRYLMTRAELLDRLAVLLGGRVAEEFTFGDVSTGAQDDLQRATDVARHMITAYGMSDTLGLATFERPREGQFLPVATDRPREYSERTPRPSTRRSSGYWRPRTRESGRHSRKSGRHSTQLLNDSARRRCSIGNR